MPFIPCSTGTVALYQGADAESVIAVPVEAWDERGTPHVAGPAALVEASTRPGFLGLEQSQAPLPKPGEKPKEPVKIGPKPRPGGPRDPEAGPPRGGGGQR
jgi:hypothetical protein